MLIQTLVILFIQYSLKPSSTMAQLDPRTALLYMFERPFEPLSAPKPLGTNESLVFSMDSNDISPTINLRGKTPMVVRINSEREDFQIPHEVMSIPRRTPFIQFLRSHQLAAKALIKMFAEAKNAQELLDKAGNVRDQINETLFIYCLSFCILNSKFLNGMRLPPIFETFPSWFVSKSHIEDAQNQIKDSVNSQNTPIDLDIDLNFTGTDHNLEHRVAYFREDYGINSHHWHWHLVYPLGLTSSGVFRDRKGELFYYMHQQMLARYDMERLSVGLRRVEKLHNYREPIPDGYFSKLNINNAGFSWGTRQDNTIISDVTRFPDERFDLGDLDLWHVRISEGIHKQYLERGREIINLTDNIDISNAENKRGIDILGDTIEADGELSADFTYYGDMHNNGHIILAYSHDPTGSHNEMVGVMGETGTAMRDPVFYRWHKYVDDLFQQYKLQQRPYDEPELLTPGVVVDRFAISSGRTKNKIFTGWNRRTFEATRGLDFGNDSVPINVRTTHLQHQAFDYHFLINNDVGGDFEVAIRIFLAPKHNEAGNTMSFMEQRLLWTEMDKFTYTLKPGRNIIQRSSKDSSITIPSEQSFRELETGNVDDASPDEAFCGCGWPQHMLVPRGKPEGMAYQLFVIVTDWKSDQVNSEASLNSSGKCKNAASFCGIKDRRIPDGRPMGYPFDRRNPPMLMGERVENVQNYARLGNAALQEITIEFQNTLIEI